MKKAIILLAVLVLSTSCVQSQWFSKTKGNGNVVNKTRNVGDYDQISVAGFFDVNLVYGTEGKLTIKIEDNLLEHLITEVVNGKLKIKWEKGINVHSRKGVYITVPFKDLDAVTMTGSGDIIGEDIINATNFYISVSGSGDITLKVKADEVISKITGSGDITLTGSAKTLETSVTGSGDYHGFGLSADSVTAKVTGSGDVSVVANKDLNARVTGSGDIEYKGNPEKQDTKVSGSGDITSK